MDARVPGQRYASAGGFVSMFSENQWPPRGLTGWLVRVGLSSVADPRSAAGRSRVGVFQGVVSVVVNLLLFLVKGVLGFWIGSVALVADAAHSLSDVGSSLIVIFGFVWARKPRDSQHPFGHGRVEFVTALVMAMVLILIAFEFARAGIQRIGVPQPVTAPLWMVGAVLGTLVVKQWVSIFARTLAQATGSQALQADYWHHVADVLSTALVVVALVAARLGWAGADGWAGLAVAGFIFYTGWQTARAAISPLLGEAPAPEEVERVERAARSVASVRGVHDLIMHKYGEDRLMSLHIEVDAGMTAMAVHDVAEQVERQIEEAVGGKAIVHVDPVDRSHPQYDVAEGIMAGVVQEDRDLSEFHDLRVEGPAHRLSVTVDVVAVVGTEESCYPAIERRVRAEIERALAGLAAVEVTVETGYHNRGR
jgi:cation diffusion facilitator family transporter